MVILTNEWHKQAMARAVPGAYWSGDRAAWVVYNKYPRGAAVALKLFPGLSREYPELTGLRDELLSDIRPFDAATEYYERTGYRVEAPLVRASLAKRGHTMHQYQEVDLAYLTAVLHQHRAAYLGWERGLGKTLGALALMESTAAQQTLIVAPNTAKRPVWEAELTATFPDLPCVVLGQSAPARKKSLLRVQSFRDAGKPFVLVVHYEALAVIAGKKTVTERGRTKTRLGDGWDRLGVTWDLVITDEDHRLNNPDTQMFRAIKKVPRDRLLLMSGSIISNHLEELYAPHARAFPDRYTSRWRDWHDRYLEYVTNGYAKVCVGVQPHAVEPMRRELGAWMTYRRKEDELDLPPKTVVDVRLDLSPAQRKAYDELVETCLTELPTGERLRSEDGIAMLGKLRQVATGLDLISDKVTDSVKLDYAVEMIRDSEDDEFVVFAWYKSAVAALEQRLTAKGVTCWSITGDTPQKDRDDAITRFAAGERRVFVGTLSTLGESVNLQRANNAVFLDRSWNPGTNAQATDRVYRQGQKRPVTITHLIAKDTVDELNVLPTLANKEALRAAILGGV